MAGSTLQSQNVQSTPRLEHLWKEVGMLKKCMTLWHEASYEAKMFKNKTPKKNMFWTTFGGCGVERMQAVVARSTFAFQCQKN